MKILLIGNGFDLYHNLPTKYSNFINTVNFLIKDYSDDMETVGDVFGNQKLFNIDSDIKNDFITHKDIFCQTPLYSDKVKMLIEKGQKNHWFKLLSKFVSLNKGWIDFEKVIKQVLSAFSSIPDRLGYASMINFHEFLSHEEMFYVSSFDIFSEIQSFMVNANMDYFEQLIPGSNVRVLSKEKVAHALFLSLKEFATMLQLYLECFIEIPLDKMNEVNYAAKNENFSDADFVVTFNYTNTFEKLYYGAEQIFHIHGKIYEEIILGVNPDESDDGESIDTTFLEFKKYYQRVYLKTDMGYTSWKRTLRNNLRLNPDRELIVAGHSLDITDRDIICEMFGLATRIKIYCHSRQAVGGYIKNLVAIFGKSNFDVLREEKRIEFLFYEEIAWG